MSQRRRGDRVGVPPAAPGKRQRVADLLDRMALTGPVGRLRGLVQRGVLVLAYHRVLELDEEDRFPFDPELVSATPAAFREQMSYLARHFTPITFAQLGRGLRGACPLPERPVVVTFDDGYLDNYTHAFPILQETGVPATMFLSTGYLGSRQPFWFDRLAYALRRAREGVLAVPGTSLRLWLGEMPTRRRATEQLVELLKTLPDVQRRRCLDRLAQRIDLEVDAADIEAGCPMSWEQVVQMSEAGIDFGSHTVTHPVLSRLDDAALQAELVESRRHLQTALGDRVETLSYPFGARADYDARVIAAARDAGYRLAASYRVGRNDARAFDCFQVRRLHVERDTSMAVFRALLALPELFSYREVAG